MRAITKRTVAFSAAIAGFALIGSGCTREQIQRNSKFSHYVRDVFGRVVRDVRNQ